MSALKSRWCWRKDLSNFRGLSDGERSGFLVALEWFENFRLRYELPAGREAVRGFWRSEVLREGAEREDWQLAQWEAALQWYLDWLEACEEAGADHRSLPERVRMAVYSAGSRVGLARRTKLCYGGWVARFGRFAGGEREAMKVGTATRFLMSVVEDEDCAYSTQKQALNALAFFFKQVCGVEKPVFDVKLRKTEARVPVVLSKGETQRLFDRMESREVRYALAARLQYGAGLRLMELVRLRIKDVDLERATLTVRSGKGDKDYPLLRRRSAVRRSAPPHSLCDRRYRAMAVDDDAAKELVRGSGETGGGSTGGLGGGPKGGAGRCVDAQCAGAEVQSGGRELRVVLAFSGNEDGGGPGDGRPEGDTRRNSAAASSA
ncbi:tyrosine-type recombinase/integrase [Haloferula chungangensis]|uniref:Tyrosine-type recombinase/integrase n=1 Tax=Haloferula chungangensis TaxID=1048331 RepID=A0ABW2L215_9BACT